MPLTANQIFVVFPHLVLTPIVGDPTLEGITTLQNKNNNNLSSLKSYLCDDTTGLLELSMPAATFTTIHPDVFVILFNPGAEPDVTEIAATNSTTKIAEIYSALKLRSQIYSEWVEVECISIKLNCAAVDETFYKYLKQQYTGYAHITLRHFLEHLTDTYTAVTLFDLEVNKQRITVVYDTN